MVERPVSWREVALSERIFFSERFQPVVGPHIDALLFPWEDFAPPFRGSSALSVEKKLGALGLRADAGRKPQDLSGGFRRRVQLAKVFMVDTPVIFLDEFSTGMDPILKRSVMELLRREVARGRTIVLTTHDSVLFELSLDAPVDDFVRSVRQAMEISVPGYPALLIDVKAGMDYGTLSGVTVERDTPALAPVLSDRPASVLLVSPGGAFDFEVGKKLADVLGKFKGGNYEVQVDLGEGEVASLPGRYHWHDRARDAVRSVGFAESGALPRVRVRFE